MIRCAIILLLVFAVSSCGFMDVLKTSTPSISAKMHNGSNALAVKSTADTYYAPVKQGVPAWQVMLAMLVVIGVLLFFVGLLIHRPTRKKNK